MNAGASGPGAASLTAEIIRDYVKKGAKLYVEGRIQTRSWDDQATGQKKYRTEIIVNDIMLLSGRGAEDGGEIDVHARFDHLGRNDPTGRVHLEI